MPVLTVKLPAPLLAQIAAEAVRRGTTKSAIVRECLVGKSSGRTLSLAVRGRHLFGSIAGPGDLAARSRKMVGYGRFRRP